MDGWMIGWMEITMINKNGWWLTKLKIVSGMMTDDAYRLPLVAVRALCHDEPCGGRHNGDGLQRHPAASVGGQCGRRAGLALDRQLPYSGELLGCGTMSNPNPNPCFMKSPGGL